MPRSEPSIGSVPGRGLGRRDDVALDRQADIADDLVEATRIAALDVEARNFRSSP